MSTLSPYAQLFIKADGITICIKLVDIIYLEAQGRQVKIVTVKKDYLTYATLAYLEEGLFPDFFWRVHRSFIVHKIHIDTIQDGSIHMGAYSIPIGQSYERQLLHNTKIKTEN